MVLLNAHIDPTFVSSVVSSPLCCQLCSVAFFVFLHGGLSQDTASQKPSVKVLGVFMRPSASLTLKVPMEMFGK